MIRIGVAGWSYEDWRGRVYPTRRPRGFHPLPHLARYLDLVEINSSFYALPRPDHAERWARLVEPFPAFRFTAKLHSAFTHGALEDLDADAARTFALGVAPLREAQRLLALLVQFPVTVREDPRGWERIERIREAFPADRLVLELRHASWFTPACYERLRELDLGLVHVDLPAARDHPPAAHPTGGPVGYLRLHGRNRATWFDPEAGRNARYDYRYDAVELLQVAQRLRAIAAHAEQTLLVANNHYRGQAVANALELRTLLEGSPARAPESLRRAFPDLADTTEPEGQMSLW